MREEQKRKIGLANSNKKIWNTGLTKENNEILKKRSEKMYGKTWIWEKEKVKRKYKGTIRSLSGMRKLRREILQRDNFCCANCMKTGGRLEIHHIKSFSKFPELRFEKNNCITLCRECHILTDNYGGKTK